MKKVPFCFVFSYFPPVTALRSKYTMYENCFCKQSSHYKNCNQMCVYILNSVVTITLGFRYFPLYSVTSEENSATVIIPLTVEITEDPCNSML